MESYRYTVSNGEFSNQQRKFYEENGFIIFKHLLSDGILDECRERFIKICDGEVKLPRKMTIVKDTSLKEKGITKGEYCVNKLQDIVFDDVLFENYINHPNILDVVRNIIGPNITACHSMLVNKPPDAAISNSRHPMHQDLHYFPFRPADCVVGVWTAMEHVNEDNGCLYGIPGSHKSKLYVHEYPDDVKHSWYHGVPGLDHVPKVNFVLEKGDTIFFHPLLLHGSGPNVTKGFRKAISAHYVNSDVYFIDLAGTPQENIKKEVELCELKKGNPSNYVDIWKTKSRLVKGRPGNYQQMRSNL